MHASRSLPFTDWPAFHRMCSPGVWHPLLLTATCVEQAMSSAAREMLDTKWAHSGARDVYADYNVLTLRIATEALFGNSLSPAQGARVRGEEAPGPPTQAVSCSPPCRQAPAVRGPTACLG